MKKIYTKVEKCRVCSSQSMTSVLNLGVQALTGVFPKTVEEKTKCTVIITYYYGSIFSQLC